MRPERSATRGRHHPRSLQRRDSTTGSSQKNVSASRAKLGVGSAAHCRYATQVSSRAERARAPSDHCHCTSAPELRTGPREPPSVIARARQCPKQSRALHLYDSGPIARLESEVMPGVGALPLTVSGATNATEIATSASLARRLLAMKPVVPLSAGAVSCMAMWHERSGVRLEDGTSRL